MRLDDGTTFGSAMVHNMVRRAGYRFLLGDCGSLPFQNDIFDMVLCSPPYESQRSYGEVEFGLSRDDWVLWAVDCFVECLRVVKDHCPVFWVVAGTTKQYKYSLSPEKLMVSLDGRGITLRRPKIFHRQGIPGSGGRDDLRNDWEYIAMATKGSGELAWSNPTAMGQPPVYAASRSSSAVCTNRSVRGNRESRLYQEPELSNPGNVISGNVGQGHMGWSDATRVNEAPYPEWLAAFLIKTYCPPGGIILDPFSGSGTTVSQAVRWDRKAIGVDVRQSQVTAGEVRLQGLTMREHAEGQAILF